MQVPFTGKWRATVHSRKALFDQRVVVSGAKSGNGIYNAVVGASFVFDGGHVELQWNNGKGSGWQPSAVATASGMTSPLVCFRTIKADDNFESQRDGDYDDVVVHFEHLDAPFEVSRRPFAIERGSLTMFPDGIFDTSQGVQYMGVRIKNTWFWDWHSNYPETGMKIGISSASRTALAALGVLVIDIWTTREQQSFGQIMDNGYVRVPNLRIGEEATVYFKLDVSNAAPQKAQIGFVAQRDAFDPHFDAPTRIVHSRIFISRSSYDKTNKELVAELPEGTLRLKLSSIVIDRVAGNKAARALLKCRENRRQAGAAQSPDSWSEDCHDRERFCRRQASQMLRSDLKDLLEGKDVDICRLQDLLERCCSKSQHGCRRDQGETDDGWQRGTGVDGWCRVQPVAWLPLSFEYKIEANPAFSGQYGPLAFEDPWWKVVLIILAVLLAASSLVYDYVEAGQDPNFIIGRVRRLGDPASTGVDGAVSDLDGSRVVDLGQSDAQNDDVNNSAPIEGLGNIVQLDRTANQNFGVGQAVLNSVVWKSGARSGTTRGVVAAINMTTNLPYDGHDTISGTIHYVNQVVIRQIAAMPQPLSQRGDSGSLWVDLATRRPVALNFAGDESDKGTDAWGNPIGEVANVLDVRFNI